MGKVRRGETRERKNEERQEEGKEEGMETGRDSMVSLLQYVRLNSKMS